MEYWQPIPGFSNRYLASNLGRIKRKEYYKQYPNNIQQLSKEKVLRSWLRGGYLSIEINNKALFVHRLVCLAFNKKPNNKDYVNHKDGDKLNNTPSNLEWCTKSENALHMYATGLKTAPKNEESKCCKYPNEIIEKVRELLKTKMKQRNIAKECGISQSLVSCVNRGLLRPIQNPIVENQS